ncbi:hypothetical protein QJR52_07125 [Clostridium baratii]|uniref:hypothetical protein n=1 Tax=Clostridium baratii TaxID=1561 RepID=UPI0030CB683A
MSNALEVKTMNRQQRRRHEQLIAWVNSLSKDKQAIIDSVVRERAAAMNLAEMVNFQMSFSAALITLHEDKFNMNDIQEIVVLANKYADDREYIRKYGKDWMIMFEKQREEMKKEMKKLYESGTKSQNSMVKSIKAEKKFKDISQKDIVVVFKELKDELSGVKVKDMEENRKDVEDALAYIFNDKKEEESLELKVIPKDIEIGDKAVVLDKEENKEVKKMSKLKVIKKELELQGEYGTYIVKDNVVKAPTGEEFKSAEDIEKYEKEMMAVFARKMTELKDVLQYV